MNVETLNIEQELKKIHYKEEYKKGTDKCLEKSFSRFIVCSLRIIFAIIGVGALAELVYFSIFQTSIILNVELILFYLILSFGVYIGIQKKITPRIMLYIMIVLGLVLRIIWAFSIENIPVSDFDVAYKAAFNVAKGDYSNMMGTAYFGRFPHMTMLVLFFSKMISLFGDNSLTAIKAVNIIFSTSTIPLIYLICKEIFKDDNRVIIGTFIAAIMSASILYTSVYCSENLAIPFYLASIYCFILVINGKKEDNLLILSGFLLMIGHLFRMVAQIIVISYIMYIIIYLGENHLKKFKDLCYILMSFLIPFVIICNLFVHLGITDRKLWNGSEPHITSILKGSNIEHFGRWNDEDSKFVDENIDNREYLEETCREKIINRYTTTSPIKIGGFFLTKLSMQWGLGDCLGSFLSQAGISQDKVKIDIWNKGSVWYQFFYLILLLLIIKGLFNKKEYLENNIINIFYIIFCGYGITFLILEAQERYAFIINWVFVILPLTALSKDSNRFALGKHCDDSWHSKGK